MPGRKKIPIRIGELVNEVVKLIASEAALRKIAIQVKIEPDIKRVVGDRVQLQQCILNLLINAFDAVKDARSQERGVAITVAPEKAGWVRISVSDNGSGVAPSVATRLFEPFVTTKREGMGLGLRLTRSIVEHHGGGSGQRRCHSRQIQYSPLRFHSREGDNPALRSERNERKSEAVSFLSDMSSEKLRFRCNRRSAYSNPPPRGRQYRSLIDALYGRLFPHLAPQLAHERAQLKNLRHTDEISKRVGAHFTHYPLAVRLDCPLKSFPSGACLLVQKTGSNQSGTLRSRAVRQPWRFSSTPRWICSVRRLRDSSVPCVIQLNSVSSSIGFSRKSKAPLPHRVHSDRQITEAGDEDDRRKRNCAVEFLLQL